jgi:BR serine/threonine kinase
MGEIPHCVGEWCLGPTLGSGTTGKVKVAENMQNSTRAAVKIIKKSQFDVRPDLERKVHREVALMKLLDHPHLLRLIDCRESPHHIYMILELGAGGELFDYLVSQQRLSRREAMGFFREIIYGLEYLHQHGICHRDLKPENILLDASNHIKIADFGFARWMKSNIAETSCGSPHYAAPEVVRGCQYDGRKADIWSVGVILFALLAGKLPFDDPSIRVLLSKVKAGRYTMPPFDADVSDLISRILQVSVDRRIGIDEIKKHPAFRRDLPDSYTVPTPIPLAAWADPINFDPLFATLLLSIGYESADEVAKELAARAHTPAKTFYRMWSRSAGLEALPWPSCGSKPVYEEWEFTMSPRAFAQSGTASAPFGGRSGTPLFESLQSPSAVSSLAMRAEWVPAADDEERAAHERFAALFLPLAAVMGGIQTLLAREEFEFFHPNELQYIARRGVADPELILNITAEFVSGEGELELDVSAMAGASQDRDLIVEKLRGMLEQLQNGSTIEEA